MSSLAKAIESDALELPAEFFSSLLRDWHPRQAERRLTQD
jgi:hypothetical protein